jgi:hypothetical protein
MVDPLGPPPVVVEAAAVGVEVAVVAAGTVTLHLVLRVALEAAADRQTLVEVEDQVVEALGVSPWAVREAAVT